MELPVLIVCCQLEDDVTRKGVRSALGAGGLPADLRLTLIQLAAEYRGVAAIIAVRLALPHHSLSCAVFLAMAQRSSRRQIPATFGDCLDHLSVRVGELPLIAVRVGLTPTYRQVCRPKSSGGIKQSMTCKGEDGFALTSKVLREVAAEYLKSDEAGHGAQ